MKPFVTIALCATVLAFAGSSSAWAVTGQSKAKPQTTEATNLTPVTVSDSYISDQTTTLNKPRSKVFQFDLKGKWGLKFDVSQPEARPSGLNDIDAGAFYKITPSVRVGGTLGFGEKTEAFKPEGNLVRNPQDKSHPRVRLETTFKF